VSPFLAVGGEYRMRLPVPDERLSLAITLRQNGSTALVASVAGVRTAATPRSLVRVVARRPLVTLRTSALIRRHGVALWLRRLPVIPRPRHAPQEASNDHVPHRPAVEQPFRATARRRRLAGPRDPTALRAARPHRGGPVPRAVHTLPVRVVFAAASASAAAARGRR
jgi:hypothetical protein